MAIQNIQVHTQERPESWSLKDIPQKVEYVIKQNK